MFFFVAVAVLYSLAYKIGDNNETLCRFTSGTWVKAGVYGDIKWRVDNDYCERPLLFGLIKTL